MLLKLFRSYEIYVTQSLILMEPEVQYAKNSVLWNKVIFDETEVLLRKGVKPI